MARMIGYVDPVGDLPKGPVARHHTFFQAISFLNLYKQHTILYKSKILHLQLWVASQEVPYLTSWFDVGPASLSIIGARSSVTR